MPLRAKSTWRRIAGGTLLGVAAAACALPKASEIDARYFAVHNVLVGTGLVQVGTVHRGALVEGAELKLSVHLEAGCATLVAFGGRGISDVDLALLDAEAHTLGEDKSHGTEASVRYCSQQGGDYLMVVKAAKGSGELLTTIWSGGSTMGSGVGTNLVSADHGTCAEPIPLADGIVRGNTKKGEEEEEGSCGGAGSNEQVYELKLERTSLLRVGYEGKFDAILYVRKGKCNDASSEAACNADARSSTEASAALAEVLEPGTYFLFVDGYANQEGAYSLDVSTKPVPSAAETCKTAKPLPLGVPVHGTLAPDQVGFKAHCVAFTGAHVPYALDLAQPMRVRLRASSTDFHPFIFLRKECQDEGSELGCSVLLPSMNDGTLITSLPAGHYTAFVGAESNRLATGAFTLEADAVPANGSPGVPGETCANAIELRGSGPIAGDTFPAADDAAGCGAPSNGSSPEIFYRFKVQRPSLFEATRRSSEGAHTLSLLTSCGDAPIECADDTLSRELAPGTYWLAVEGSLSSKPMSGAGAYEVDITLRDLAATKKACDAAPKLERNKPMKGSLRGGSPRFSLTGLPGSGADKVYRFDVPETASYEITLTGSGGFAGAMALRSACSTDTTEVACSSSDDGFLSAELSRGTYYLVVKGEDGTTSGDYEINLRKSVAMP